MTSPLLYWDVIMLTGKSSWILQSIKNRSTSQLCKYCKCEISSGDLITIYRMVMKIFKAAGFPRLHLYTNTIIESPGYYHL